LLATNAAVSGGDSKLPTGTWENRRQDNLSDLTRKGSLQERLREAVGWADAGDRK
jgi:hypothetical protein